MSIFNLSFESFGKTFPAAKGKYAFDRQELEVGRELEHFGPGELILQIPNRWNLDNVHERLARAIKHTSFDYVQNAPLVNPDALNPHPNRRYIAHQFPSVNGVPKGFDSEDLQQLTVPYDDFVVDTFMFCDPGCSSRTMRRAFGVRLEGSREIEWIARVNSMIFWRQPRCIYNVARNPWFAAEHAYEANGYRVGLSFFDAVDSAIYRGREPVREHKKYFGITEAMSSMGLHGTGPSHQVIPTEVRYAKDDGFNWQGRYRRFKNHVEKALSDPQQAPDNVIIDVKSYYKQLVTQE